MRAIFSSGGWIGLLAAVVVFSPAGTGQPANRGASGTFELFSPGEYHRLYKETGEMLAARRKAAEELEYDAIELEPYVVHGDRSLLFASLRRQMELGPESMRQRVAEISKVLARQARFSGRAGEQFLIAPTPGAPLDAPRVATFSTDQLAKLGTWLSRVARAIVPGSDR